MKRFMLIFFAIVIILYMLPLVLLTIFQRSFMYFPPNAYLSPADTGLVAAQEVVIPGDKGVPLTAWWMPPKRADAPVIMFFHGNGSAVYSNYNIYKDLHSRGYGVLGTGYAGYPGSGGKHRQNAIVDGAQAQYDWLAAQGISPDNIIFYGTSLGSGIAAQLAGRRKPAMLIAEAPFNSTLDIGRASMPIFPVKLFMKDTYRSDLALGELDIPLVWMHGTADRIIPISQGQKLYDGYNGPKTFKVFEGGQHTNLWALGGREFVIAEIEDR